MDDRLVAYLQRQSEYGPDRFREFRKAVESLSRGLKRHRAEPTESGEVQARTLLSECLDYLGKYDRAATVLRPYHGDAVLHHLRSHDVKRFARVMLRLSITTYRAFHFPQSKALVDRSLHAYMEAEDYFGQTLALFHASKIAYRQSNPEQARSYLEASIQILTERIPDRGSYRKALSRILLGWYALRAGRLSEAGSNVAEAQLALAKTEDFVNLARIQDIRGHIYRSGPPDQWPLAIAAFNAALRLYKRTGHDTYRARTLNYAGQTCERLGRFAKAARMLDEAARTRSQDPRTLVENKCYRARLLLSSTRWRQAQTAVDAALREASRRQFRRLQAQALITKARLKLARSSDRDSLNQASELLLQAEILNRTPDRTVSQKTVAATSLLMAQVHCRKVPPETVLAEAQLNRARRALRVVQNHVLEKLAAAVATEIRAVDDAFHIGLEPHMSLSYRQHEELLHFWLVRQAVKRVRSEEAVLPPVHRRRQTVDREKVAQLLGMERQGLENWLRAWRDERKPLVGVNPQAVRAVLAEFNLEPTKITPL